MQRSAWCLLILLVGVGFNAQAKVYKWVMPDGSIQYSDKPQVAGAKEVELPPLQLYTAPPTPPPASASAKADEKKAANAQGYDVVKVAQPGAGEVIRDNGGSVNVRLELDPALRPGHTVEILLDGKSIGSGSATSASVTNVDRGSHTVSAVVKDAAGNTVATAAGVTFHLKQTSRLQPHGPPPPGGGGS